MVSTHIHRLDAFIAVAILYPLIQCASGYSGALRQLRYGFAAMIPPKNFIFCSCEKITYDEIVGLYSSYDEDVYNRFNELYKWYRTGNGRAMVDFYRRSMIKANDLYKENFGESFFLSNRELDWTLEQRLSFEEFIRSDPDFMPAEEYEQDQAHLGIK